MPKFDYFSVQFDNYYFFANNLFVNVDKIKAKNT